MIIVGIDPSGPSNHKDTCIVWFRDEVVELIFQDYISGASDKSIVDLISDLADEEQVCIGLDAPLSYNDGGGMRPCDKHLQATIIPIGMHPGSVMPPTLTRMAYLTLRGYGISRSISHLETKHIVKVVETHPGATFALGGAPIGAVRDYSRNRESRSALFDWLVENELHGIPEDLVESSHLIASCGCALAAWKWLHNESQWCWPSNPFHHLFDFAC
jgi:predicted nuclease with RNAse H fold